MLTFNNWSQFLKIVEYGGAAVAVVLNSILLILIVYRSPKNLGAYKYLMVYISVFEIVYSIMDAIVEPNIFSSGPSFMVFRFFKHSSYGRNSGFYLVVLYCASFGLCVALFGIHFIYRYGAVDNVFRKKYLTGRKLIALFLIPIGFLVWWSAVCIVLFRPSTQSDSVMRIPLLVGFDTRIEDVSYLIVHFHVADKHGEFHPNWLIFFGMSNMWCMIASSFFCIIYFGIKCYVKLTQSLKKSKIPSYYIKSIQQQLFQALLMQTLIPVVLMYAPIGVLFFFPMFNIEVGFISSFVTATIAIYPAVDPLPTMFIIKSYRKALLCCFDRKPKKRAIEAIELQS
ncbi:hypothetical protein CAEBREN_08056 [Caenorhabditis brenneri]|uniref:Serpentine receptor class r-10 n=1 Tax=Caenorhabditis brenneri TaxID=135651 RepID=G0P2I7_CAEBE|nr:hypothetical protein CAEBREN_08056 [Caenorhabditis brenneri]